MGPIKFVVDSVDPGLRDEVIPFVRRTRDGDHEFVAHIDKRGEGLCLLQITELDGSTLPSVPIWRAR